MSTLAEAFASALAKKKNPAGKGEVSQRRQTMLDGLSVERGDVLVNDLPAAADNDAANQQRAQRWLEQRILRMRREGEFAELNVWVFPEVAVELLKLNTNNRRLKKGHIPSLCAAAQEGRWINTGHPIIISSDGVLQDGQHRLTAVLQAGSSIKMDLRFGIDPRAFAVTDIGAKRSGADTLQVAGYCDEATLSAAARVLYGIEKGVAAGSIRDFPNDLILKFVRERPGIQDAARIGHSSAGPLKSSGAALSAAAYLIGLQHGTSVADEYFTELRRGAGSHFDMPNRPMARLHRMLKDGDFRSGQQVTAACVLGWNFQSKNRSLRSDKAFFLASGEPFPKVI